MLCSHIYFFLSSNFNERLNHTLMIRGFLRGSGVGWVLMCSKAHMNYWSTLLLLFTFCETTINAPLSHQHVFTYSLLSLIKPFYLNMIDLVYFIKTNKQNKSLSILWNIWLLLLWVLYIILHYKIGKDTNSSGPQEFPCHSNHILKHTHRGQSCNLTQRLKFGR